MLIDDVQHLMLFSMNYMDICCRYLSIASHNCVPACRLCSGGFVSQVELTMSKEEVNGSAGGASSDTLTGAAPLSPTLTGPLDDMDGECGICFELMECPTKTPCGHW